MDREALWATAHRVTKESDMTEQLNNNRIFGTYYVPGAAWHWSTHLEPDILECEVKWALGSITMNKASGGDRIPVELFQFLKHDAVKVLHIICQQIWKTQQWPQDWKRSVFIPTPKMAMPKNAQTTAQLHSPHSLVM